MCPVHTFLMELEYTVYYLSPDTFSCIFSTHFLHEHCNNPCPIT